MVVDKIRVAKFGGTSLMNASCIQQATRIVKDTRASVVVVSAMGGVTNLLDSLSSEVVTDSLEYCLKKLCDIEERHILAAKLLHCTSSEKKEIQALIEESKMLITGMNLLGEVSLRSKDRLLSIGEKLSSILILASFIKEGIKAIKVDASEIIITNENFGQAEPILGKIKTCVKEYIEINLASGKVIVTQGFIGATLEGVPTTLGRGGSDYSAALLAEALHAELLSIWTDVPGVLRVDPRVVGKNQVVSELSFEEAAELATFGAKVLHPATLCPAIRCNIPVFVASTMQPEAGGTWIKPAVKSYPVIRGIAVRRKQLLLTARSVKMFHAHGFLGTFFTILANHCISVDLITTSEISVAITIDNPIKLTDHVVRELRQIAQIEIEYDLALVALVGNRLTSTPGIANQVFSIIKQFNIRLTCHGASDRNFCFLVNESELDEIVILLNKQLLEMAEED